MSIVIILFTFNITLETCSVILVLNSGNEVHICDELLAYSGNINHMYASIIDIY